VTRALPALVALALVLYPTRASAADPCTEVERPCYLKRGDRAPWGGELWPSALAMAVLEDRAAGLIAIAERDKALADLEAEKRGRQVDRDEAKAEIDASEAARERAERLARELVEPPAWYERPGFIIPTTAAVTLAVTLGVIFAAR